MSATAAAIRIVHKHYGSGWFDRLADIPGQAWATFDGTPSSAAGERRVLVRDLTPETLRERAERTDCAVADMMGHDVRAVTRCLSGGGAS